ncbi:MAG: hypothetical protein IKQ97_06885 [Eubacterium sp.]|nr:hypothetical protein [Eubacterium sp.]
MQTNNPEKLLKLKKGDLVNATFSDIEGNVIEANGRLEQISKVSIALIDADTGQVREYELWRMLSLVCMERDISFLREGDIMSDLERVAYSLDSRLPRDGQGKKRRKHDKHHDSVG